MLSLVIQYQFSPLLAPLSPLLVVKLQADRFQGGQSMAIDPATIEFETSAARATNTKYYR